MTPFGMLMLSKDLHQEKASFPMRVIALGMLTLRSEMQLLNVPSLMAVTELGMLMLWSD